MKSATRNFGHFALTLECTDAGCDEIKAQRLSPLQWFQLVRSIITAVFEIISEFTGGSGDTSATPGATPP